MQYMLSSLFLMESVISTVLEICPLRKHSSVYTDQTMDSPSTLQHETTFLSQIPHTDTP